jgi:hypothetical protein
VNPEATARLARRHMPRVLVAGTPFPEAGAGL